MRFASFILYCSLLLLPSSIFAAGISVPLPPSGGFNGFYAGLGGGANYTTARVKWDTQAIALDPVSLDVGEDFFDTFRNSIDSNLHDYSPIGSFFLGYGHELGQHFYLGAEAAIAFSQANMQVKHVTNASFNFSGSDALIINGNTQTRAMLRLNTVEFDGDLKFGYLSSPQTLFFGLVGVAVNRVKFSTQSQFNYSVIGGEFPGEGGGSLALMRAKTEAGLRLGGGIEHFITDNLTVGLTYIYTCYSGIHLNGTASTNGVFIPIVQPVTNWSIANGLQNHAQAKSIDSQTVMVDLTYYFHHLV